MKLDANHSQIQSYTGSCLSILVICIILAYAYLKADVLIARKDVDVLSAININEFTPDDEFSYRNGLNIAISLKKFGIESA